MRMKLAISAGALCLLLGTIAPAYAQHEEEKRPAQQGQAERKPAQPQHEAAPRPKTAQPAYGGVYHGGVKANGPTNGGVHYSGVPQHAGQVRSGFAQARAANWASVHRTWGQRGGYNGYRIPEDRFRLYFGRGHFFHIGGLPLVFVGGYPRFQYDGYWLTFVDPFPAEWAPNWYETDNVYIDYVDDGYYLFDSSYPGIPIAVTISF